MSSFRTGGNEEPQKLNIRQEFTHLESGCAGNMARVCFTLKPILFPSLPCLWVRVICEIQSTWCVVSGVMRLQRPGLYMCQWLRGKQEKALKKKKKVKKGQCFPFTLCHYNFFRTKDFGIEGFLLLLGKDRDNKELIKSYWWSLPIGILGFLEMGQ